MKVGIIGAMESETAHLYEILGDAKETSIANLTFCEGKIGNTDTVVVRCGVGKVNAALCAQILIDRAGKLPEAVEMYFQKNSKK